MRRYAMTLLLLAACGDGDVVDTGLVDVPESDGLPDGEYLMGISLAPVSGLLVPFQVTVETAEIADDGTSSFVRFEARATDPDYAVSDVLVSLTDVPITEFGTFTAELTFTLPAAFSPTLSDVDLTATLAGSITDEQFFCGDVTGNITTLDIDLEGSSFGAVPWAERTDGAAGSCDDDRNATIARLDVADCPAVVVGNNTDFPSGDSMRSFIVELPDSYVDGTPAPLAFAWHGFGGTAAGFLGGGLSNAANANDTILVVPQALEKGGQNSFDPFSDARRNYDLAFYDDMLTCIQNSFTVDSTRVYTTGMSNGGLMTGMLLAARSSTFAAAAPWSGGMQVAFSSPHDKIPALVSWGGK